MGGVSLGIEEKKLREAGAYWAGGRTADSSLEELEAFGAPAAVLEKQKPTDEGFEVWPENWEAVLMFLRMQTQWIVGMSGAVGLNYPSLETLCRVHRVKNRAKIFDDVRDIEAGALAAWADAREKAEK